MDQALELKLERVLSKERLSGYTTSKANAYGCASITVYRWNTLLAESLYPSLQTIEIILRNALHAAISEHFGDSEWIFNPKILQPKELIEATKQEELLKRVGQNFVIGKVIAELNFGFWTSLLDARYEMILWRSKIIKNTFPYMPGRERMRHNLSRHFNQIRKLRNRIFHYEPIWHWQDLAEQHQKILLAIRWIEPQALILCEPDRFLSVYQQGPKSLEVNP